jgi:hypothetical protein
MCSIVNSSSSCGSDLARRWRIGRASAVPVTPNVVGDGQTLSLHLVSVILTSLPETETLQCVFLRLALLCSPVCRTPGVGTPPCPRGCVCQSLPLLCLLLLGVWEVPSLFSVTSLSKGGSPTICPQIYPCWHLMKPWCAGLSSASSHLGVKDSSVCLG